MKVNNKQSSLSEQTYLSLWGVMKYVFRGSLIYWKKDSIRWDLIIVPRFPFFLSILAGIFFYLPVLFKAFPKERVPFNLREFIFAFIISCTVGSLIIIFLNFIILHWFRFVLRLRNRRSTKNSNENIIKGSQRVLYFSTFFQALLFIAMLIFGRFQGFFNYSDWFMYSTGAIVSFIGIIRLFYIFQAIRYESGGSLLAGLLAIIMCLDVWFVLFGSLYDIFLIT